MKIRRMEIIGFKSFCDRSVIDIEADITAIVGPNGCGKSNIVDAVRWCMGEQSAKHLRGKAMDDVIFAGSESRGAASMAEVSLTFEDVTPAEWALPETQPDQDVGSDILEGEPSSPEESGEQADEATPTDGQAEGSATPTVQEDDIDVADLLGEKPANVDFSQFSEVTVTRRLFRDGTSQYLINRIPCRLRDVHDFFLGSGVGTKAYSIIEQGRVGQIVSARASDRRSIIDEAAGITKFKKRRRAAERRLEQTKQNLARVSDIVTELETRQSALKRQAQKAERYRRYKDELRDLELWHACCEYLRIRVENRSGELAISQGKERLAELKEASSQKEATVRAGRNGLSRLEQRLAELKENQFAIENEYALADSKMQFRAKELQELTSRTETNRSRRDDLEARHRDKEAAIAEQRDGLSSLQQEFEAVRLQLQERQELTKSLQADVSRLDSERREAGEAAARLRDTLSRLSERIENAQNARETGAKKLAEVEEHSERARHDLSRQQSAVNAAEATLSKLRQTQMDLGEQLEQLVRQREQLAEERKRLAKSLSEQKVLLAERKSRLASLTEIQARYEGMLGGTRAVMTGGPNQQPIAGVMSLVADKMLVPEEYEKAIEGALGAMISGIIVEDKDAAMRAIDLLRQSDGGEAVFVPHKNDMAMTAHLPHDEAVIGWARDLVNCSLGSEFLAQKLLADTVVVKTTADALRLAGQSRLVSLDGDVVEKSGIVWGCHDRGRHAGILSRRREIETLKSLVEDLMRDTARLEGESTQCQARLVQTEKALETRKREAHDGEVQLAKAEKDLSSAASGRDAAKNRLAELDAACLRLRDSQQEAVRLGNQLEVETQENKAALDRVVDRMTNLEAIYGRSREELTQANEQLTELQVNFARLREKQASVENTTAQLQEAALESANRLTDIKQALHIDEARIEELTQEAKLAEEEKQRIAEKRQAIETDIAAAKEALSKGQSELEEVEQELRNLRQDIESLGQEVNQAEVSMANASTDLRVLRQTTMDRHQVRLEDTLFDYHHRGLVTQTELARVEELKRLLRRMGDAVNLTAIDEYREVSERYEYLSAQNKDLHDAVEQLERAIRKINRTSRRIFKDTFELINNKFKEVYPRLFRGGKAYLALTEADDVLEAGVEIFARPPGKKNTTVDQLSGGEKALTAVALIFSIFLIKPSPFCILDEVDAPLDDANVDRYNEMIREMTDKSQFIIISHNKRTMEIADKLFGVTMQVPGVSKLVSVAIGKAAKNAAA